MTDAAELPSLERALVELRRVIVGQERLLERLMVALIAGGHCLLEGPPGLAKTLAVRTFAETTGGSFSRIQFTPDLLPADVTGTRVYRASSERFDVELGPVFANFVLADEINRAPAKVQSALLEVMGEGQVTIGGETFDVPRPFLVLATQNPIESEGVYALPEAQRDRFLMKVLVDYPTASEEMEIVRRMGTTPPVAEQVLDPEAIASWQTRARDMIVDQGVLDYAVNLVLATRDPAHYGMADLAPMIDYGASPRASLGLIAAGRALAGWRDGKSVSGWWGRRAHRVVEAQRACDVPRADVGVEPARVVEHVLEPLVAHLGDVPLADVAVEQARPFEL